MRPPLPGRLRRTFPVVRILLGVLLGTATVAGLCLAGVTATMADSHRLPDMPTPAGGWPAPPPERTGGAGPPASTVVAVLVGSTTSVVSDVLAPYEVFGRSPAFRVYTVARERAPMALTGGLPLLPDHTFAEVASGAAPRPDIVVVPAVAEPTGAPEAPARGWIAAQLRRGAKLLGVCSGGRLLAAAGVLDGRRATSFWADIGPLERSHPQVDWVRGERYVQDGPVTTTAGVTSGIVGALRLVEEIAGAAEAERIGREVAFPGWSIGGDTGIPAHRLAPGDLPYALNAAFPWGRPTIGIGLADGVSEIDAAAVFEMHSATSSTARAVPIATDRIVTTRHGLRLVANPVGDGPPEVDRFLVPGAGNPAEVEAGLREWAATRGVDVELPHGDRRPGESGFDAVLRDLAENADRATARAAAKFTEYPDGHLRLTGPAWPWRSTAQLVVVLMIGVAAGVVLPLLARLARPAGRQVAPVGGGVNRVWRRHRSERPGRDGGAASRPAPPLPRSSIKDLSR